KKSCIPNVTRRNILRQQLLDIVSENLTARRRWQPPYVYPVLSSKTPNLSPCPCVAKGHASANGSLCLRSRLRAGPFKRPRNSSFRRQVVQFISRSAQGQTRTSADVCHTTASPSEADMPGSPSDVAEVPSADSCTATNKVSTLSPHRHAGARPRRA